MVGALTGAIVGGLLLLAWLVFICRQKEEVHAVTVTEAWKTEDLANIHPEWEGQPGTSHDSWKAKPVITHV